MGGEQPALPYWPRWLPIEPVLGDRLDRSIGTGANVETAIAGRFQSLGAVLSGQTQDAETRTVALLGVGPALQDQRGELGGARANRRRFAADPLDRSFGVAPMGTRHVLGDRCVPAVHGTA
jgi:hypothetical protein